MQNGRMNRLILFIAQGAYSGRSPFAPGTAGSVVGVLLYLCIAHQPLWGYLLACGATTLVGIWSAGKAEDLLGRKDDGSIVIDEIAGFLVSMILVPPARSFIVAGFFLFRFFDVVKPWPLRRLQDLHGGAGVVLDDIGAGIYTNITLQLATWIIKS